jgi:predicted transcriptional regulator
METQYGSEEDIYVITPESSLQEAISKMQDLGACTLPVFDEGQCVSFLRTRDIAVYLSFENKVPQKTTVYAFLKQQCNNGLLSLEDLFCRHHE